MHRSNVACPSIRFPPTSMRTVNADVVSRGCTTRPTNPVGTVAFGFGAFFAAEDVVDCDLPIANARENTITVARPINTMRRRRT